jgi:hypothetical protein
VFYHHTQPKTNDLQNGHSFLFKQEMMENYQTQRLEHMGRTVSKSKLFASPQFSTDATDCQAAL